MKMRKFLAAGLSLAIGAAALTGVLSGCGAKKLDTPQNLTYNKSTGAFSFDAVSGGETYQLTVSRRINNNTGVALTSNLGSSIVTLEDGTQVYVWTQQAGAVTGLSDSDGDGVVSGTVIYRTYSNSATDSGTVITDLSELPLGHYYVFATANETTDGKEASDSAMVEFVMGGTLAEPDFKWQINSDNHIVISENNSYYYNSLAFNGLPEEVKFEVKKGDTVVETITVDDFSYENVVNGPTKNYNFNNASVEGTATLDAANYEQYTVTATAVGDGETILSSTATVEYGTASSGSSGGGFGGGGDMGGGGDQGGGGASGWAYSVSGTYTIDLSADTNSFPVGSSQTMLTDATITLNATATSGSSYTFTVQNVDGNAPFLQSGLGTLELLEGGTATISLLADGPLSAYSATGTWTKDGNTITVVFA